jgi:hypothetical protein
VPEPDKTSEDRREDADVKEAREWMKAMGEK